jgi:hypothetical protein
MLSSLRPLHPKRRASSAGGTTTGLQLERRRRKPQDECAEPRRTRLLAVQRFRRGAVVPSALEALPPAAGVSDQAARHDLREGGATIDEAGEPPGCQSQSGAGSHSSNGSTQRSRSWMAASNGTCRQSLCEPDRTHELHARPDCATSSGRPYCSLRALKKGAWASRAVRSGGWHPQRWRSMGSPVRACVHFCQRIALCAEGTPR